MQIAKPLLAALTLVGMVAPPARAELEKVGRTGLVALDKSGEFAALVDDVAAVHVQAGDIVLHLLQSFRRMPLPLRHFGNHA
jgi:hypothetical protein